MALPEDELKKKKNSFGDAAAVANNPSTSLVQQARPSQNSPTNHPEQKRGRYQHADTLHPPTSQTVKAKGNEMTPDFSIIVPVYNSEQYLEKCINAVLNQGDYNYALPHMGVWDKTLGISMKGKRNNQTCRLSLVIFTMDR